MKTIKHVLSLILITFCLASAASVASAATFIVIDTVDTADIAPGDGTCGDFVGVCSFRAAITEANALPGDDTITLPAGTYTQSLVAANDDNNAGGDWDIRGNITINGAGAATTVLQANAAPDTAAERVLHSVLSTNVVTINGITVRHGKKAGAASDTTRGAGIYNNGGSLTINNSTVSQNRSSGGGGIYNSNGNIAINGSTISNNRCEDPSIQVCYGGGVYNALSSVKNVTVTTSVFTGNNSVGNDSFSAGGIAPGLGVETQPGTGVIMNVSNSFFSGNVGFGIGFDPGAGGGQGGAIYVNSRANNNSIVNISNTVISGNELSGGPGGNGAGIYLSSGGGNLTGTWDKLTVASNHATQTGMGIYIGSFGNTAMTLNITNSAIHGNTPGFGTSNGGGGAHISGAQTTNAAVNFLNTTFSGNTAGVGGGVRVVNFDSAALAVNFNFCTIAGNSTLDMFSGGGGGISSAFTSVPPSVNLQNTIVADNAAGSGAGPDILGPVISQNYNHIENLSGATFTPLANDSSGFDPQLGALQNNGGPTMTKLLAVSSPLVNVIPNGANTCGPAAGGVAIDQRALPRPAMDRCEPGATEIQSFPGGPFSVSGKVTTDGGIPVRNIVVVLSGGGPPQPIFVQTGSLGNYQFSNVPASGYTISISSKRYVFTQDGKFINVISDLSNVNFSGVPATSRTVTSDK